MSRRRPPEFEVEESEDYQEIHVDSVFGGLSPNGGKMVLFMDKHIPKVQERGPPGNVEIDKIVKVKKAELHMSPVQFKSIAQWMIQHVKEYEQKYGEIDIGQDTQKPRDSDYT